MNIIMLLINIVKLPSRKLYQYECIIAYIPKVTHIRAFTNQYKNPKRTMSKTLKNGKFK